MTAMASLLSSTSSSLLRKTPNLNPGFFRTFSVKPSPVCSRSLQPITASLLSPPPPPLLSKSTLTLTSLFSLILSVARSLSPSPRPLSPLFTPTSTLFFARIRGHGGASSTPLAVVASAMARWLDLYSGVLMLRVLLSWFPNIPWDRQPFSAIRDMCDPYLSLFRNVIPVFNTIDLSPILAFAVLGFLSSILNTSIN